MFLPEKLQIRSQTWTRNPVKPLLKCWRSARNVCRLPRCGKETQRRLQFLID